MMAGEDVTRCSRLGRRETIRTRKGRIVAGMDEEMTGSYAMSGRGVSAGTMETGVRRLGRARC